MSLNLEQASTLRAVKNLFSQKRICQLLTALLLVGLAQTLWAQNDDEEETKIYELSWFDRKHLKEQEERIDNIARTELGTQIRHNADDLDLLQRIVNKGLIKHDQRLELQAMGTVLGNMLAQDLDLQWMVYEDKVGRSRALCVKNTDHCLFPITMISRRMEVGIIVNVKDLYQNAVDIITPYIPPKPYTVQPKAK